MQLLSILIGVAALCLTCFAIGLTVGSLLAPRSQAMREPRHSPEQNVEGTTSQLAEHRTNDPLRATLRQPDRSLRVTIHRQGASEP